MKNKTSKNRRKAIQANIDRRKVAESFNGTLAGIDKDKIEKSFPDKQKRVEYIRALQEGLQ